MNINLYRKNNKLKGVSLSLCGCGFAKIGVISSLNIGESVNLVKIGSNFSLTFFGKTISHSEVAHQ